MFRVRPARSRLPAVDGARSSPSSPADDETGSRAAALDGGLGRPARPPVGRRIRAASFGHDGHNLMRYRPEAVSAAILSVAGETGR